MSGMNLVTGPLRTIKVKSAEHDDQVVRINKDDFDPKIHTEVSSKKKELKIGSKKKSGKKAEAQKKAIDKLSKKGTDIHKSPADSAEVTDEEVEEAKKENKH